MNKSNGVTVLFFILLKMTTFINYVLNKSYYEKVVILAINLFIVTVHTLVKTLQGSLYNGYG